MSAPIVQQQRELSLGGFTQEIRAILSNGRLYKMRIHPLNMIPRLASDWQIFTWASHSSWTPLSGQNRKVFKLQCSCPVAQQQTPMNIKDHGVRMTTDYSIEGYLRQPSWGKWTPAFGGKRTCCLARALMSFGLQSLALIKQLLVP
ncbi:hypothetical protein E4U34_000691 [Claviceps purpurea]|nr:hypothetical protein E4U34_000691 [Claviceps purpurea]